MDTVANFFTANPYVMMIVNACGIIGVILAIVFYIRAKERFALSYRVAEKLLIQSASKLPFDMDVPLSRNGVEVTKLTRTFLLIRNTGNKLIEETDFVEMPSLRVASTSAILDFQLVVADDPASNIMVGPPSGDVRNLLLKFLRPGDGFVLKVDHTGGINELYVNLRTKAGGPIKKINENARGIFAMVGTIILVTAAGFSARYFFPWDSKLLGEDEPYLLPILHSFLTGIVVFLVIGGLVFALDWLVEKTIRASRPPRVRRSTEVFTDITLNKKDALPIR